MIGTLNVYETGCKGSDPARTQASSQTFKQARTSQQASQHAKHQASKLAPTTQPKKTSKRQSNQATEQRGKQANKQTYKTNKQANRQANRQTNNRQTNQPTEPTNKQPTSQKKRKETASRRTPLTYIGNLSHPGEPRPCSRVRRLLATKSPAAPKSAKGPCGHLPLGGSLPISRASLLNGWIPSIWRNSEKRLLNLSPYGPRLWLCKLVSVSIPGFWLSFHSQSA